MTDTVTPTARRGTVRTSTAVRPATNGSTVTRKWRLELDVVLRVTGRVPSNTSPLTKLLNKAARRYRMLQSKTKCGSGQNKYVEVVLIGTLIDIEAAADEFDLGLIWGQDGTGDIISALKKEHDQLVSRRKADGVPIRRPANRDM